MKVRSRISLIFIMLTASLLLGAFSIVYFLSFRYAEREFYERLAERSLIVGQSHFEEDELSAHMYAEIRERYLRRLQGERETIIEIDTARMVVRHDSAVHRFPDGFVQSIVKDNYAQTKSMGLYHVGIRYNDNQGSFVVIVSATDAYGDAMLANLRDTLIFLFFSGLLLLFVIGRYYSGKVLAPIADISAKANQISGSQLHVRLPSGKENDELDELARTINRMLDRLEQDFENQMNFISNASHELRNPLTAILGEIEIALQRIRTAEEYQQSLNIVGKEAQRIDDLVTSLLQLAIADSDPAKQELDTVRIDDLLGTILTDATRLHAATRILLDDNHPDGDPAGKTVLGRRQLLYVALWNVVDNACKFSENRDVRITISHYADNVGISVVDQGMGIPQADLPHVEETLYRAPNARGFQGFGLGLALARKIVQLHAGSMQISSELGSGTTVEISFPLYNNADAG